MARAGDVLDVDIGNTYIKWRVAGTQKVMRQLTEQLLVIGWRCDLQDIARIRFASVAGGAVNKAFVCSARQRWGVEPECAVVRQGVARVRPCYKDLSRLGVDRWLAMLAVFSAVDGACVVVSAGSALTADWLDDNGGHLGGLIAPGRERLIASLHFDLAQVLPSAELPFVAEAVLGDTTESCSAVGVRALLAGFMADVVGRNKAIPVWLAGGDSDAMLSVCTKDQKHRIQKVDNLVLDGLAIAMP